MLATMTDHPPLRPRLAPDIVSARPPVRSSPSRQPPLAGTPDHDHAHPPPGPTPARRLPPLRPRDRPPRPDPAAGLHGRGRPTMRADIATPHLAVEHVVASAWPVERLGRPAARRPGRLRGPRRRDRRPRRRRARPDRRPLVRPGHPPVPRVPRPGDRRLAPFPEPPRVLVRGPGRPARRPGRGDRDGRRGRLPLRPELPGAQGRDRLDRRHRRPPGPDPGRLRLPLGRRRAGPPLARSSPAATCPATSRSRSAGPRPTSSSASAPGRSGWRS